MSCYWQENYYSAEMLPQRCYCVWLLASLQVLKLFGNFPLTEKIEWVSVGPGCCPGDHIQMTRTVQEEILPLAGWPCSQCVLLESNLLKSIEAVCGINNPTSLIYSLTFLKNVKVIADNIYFWDKNLNLLHCL